MAMSYKQVQDAERTGAFHRIDGVMHKIAILVGANGRDDLAEILGEAGANHLWDEITKLMLRVNKAKGN